MEEVDRIECADDEGNRYTVVIYQSFKTFRPLSGPPRKVPGIKDARLLGGGHVNVSDDEMNTFQILETDTIIRRI